MSMGLVCKTMKEGEMRETAKAKPVVGPNVTKLRLGWYGDIRRRDPEDVSRMVLDKDAGGLPGKRSRGVDHASDGWKISGEV